jgi:hypothetical protein
MTVTLLGCQTLVNFTSDAFSPQNPEHCMVFFNVCVVSRVAMLMMMVAQKQVYAQNQYISTVKGRFCACVSHTVNRGPIKKKSSGDAICFTRLHI